MERSGDKVFQICLWFYFALLPFIYILSKMLFFINLKMTSWNYHLYKDIFIIVFASMGKLKQDLFHIKFSMRLFMCLCSPFLSVCVCVCVCVFNWPGSEPLRGE